MQRLSVQTKQVQDIWRSIHAKLKKLEQLEADAFVNPALANNLIRDLHNNLGKLEEYSHFPESIHEWLADIEKGVSKRTENLGVELANKLDLGLRQLGYTLAGNLPLLKARYFTLRVKQGSGSISLSYGPEQETLAKLPMDPKKIIDFITDLKLGSSIPSDTFLKLLRHASVRTSSGPDSRAPICEVLREMVFLMQADTFNHNPNKETFREYRRVDFSYDLFRVRNEFMKGGNSLPFELTVATKAFTSARKHYLWIPDSEDGQGSLYSHLRIT